MNRAGTEIARDLQETPAAVRRQEASSAVVDELAGRCRRRPPDLVVTCARGSSAHAATFGKHLIERHLGIPVAAAAPNIATVYGRRLKLRGQLVLAVSQSGASDDLTELVLMAKSQGAVTAGIINDLGSALASACDLVLPMAAGPERGVAATKTFIASLAMLLRLVAAWADDDAMRAAVERLPDRLGEAGRLHWTRLEGLAEADSLITIGRGPTLAIAREAALKLKETCHLHAEAFSGAEFQHGPRSLVSPRYPIVMFMPTDEAAAGMARLADDLKEIGATVLSTGRAAPGDADLPALPSDHPDTDAACLIRGFYGMMGRLADLRGTNPDRPRHLQKVTRTR